MRLTVRTTEKDFSTRFYACANARRQSVGRNLKRSLGHGHSGTVTTYFPIKSVTTKISCRSLSPFEILIYAYALVQLYACIVHWNEHVSYLVLCVRFLGFVLIHFRCWYYLFWLKWCRLHTPIQSKTRCRCRCWFQSFILSFSSSWAYIY